MKNLKSNIVDDPSSIVQSLFSSFRYFSIILYLKVSLNPQLAENHSVSLKNILKTPLIALKYYINIQYYNISISYVSL